MRICSFISIIYWFTFQHIFFLLRLIKCLSKKKKLYIQYNIIHIQLKFYYFL